MLTKRLPRDSAAVVFASLPIVAATGCAGGRRPPAAGTRRRAGAAAALKRLLHTALPLPARARRPGFHTSHINGHSNLNSHGNLPLPVRARRPGAAAAPTEAG